MDSFNVYMRLIYLLFLYLFTMVKVKPKPRTSVESPPGRRDASIICIEWSRRTPYWALTTGN
uniref:Uncharacterized protein n=1 Tax=Picea glauca TaxID=3330 RepID=A0A117NFK1_PICGL|nr:hypothetical protein ABT39_MTgene3408 [Picea glauca]QHR86873.1 hypothetical protein Q903MT_gene880 [Picea sitchensis]